MTGPITIEYMDNTDRLDRALLKLYPQWGRQAVNRLIGNRHVRVNGKTVWIQSWKVNPGDEIIITKAPVTSKTVKTPAFDPAWVLRNDGDLIVVNKPAGLLSQGTKGQSDNNLLYLAEQYFGPITLFHRLDRDTSGVVLLTKSKAMNRHLDLCFKQRTIRKQYIAIVHTPNKLETSGIIHLRLRTHDTRRDMMQVVERGGKSAQTDYEILHEADYYQRVKLRIHTGRMHQIRVHLAYYGAYVVGDKLYGKDQESRLMLHAHQIEIPPLPDRHRLPQLYTAPIPAEFDQYV